MKTRQAEYTYIWLCADGGIDLHCYMELQMSLDPENGDIVKIDRVACETVSMHSPVSVVRIREPGVIAFLVQQFVNQYTANRLNLKDDVQSQVTARFPALY